MEAKDKKKRTGRETITNECGRVNENGKNNSMDGSRSDCVFSF